MPTLRTTCATPSCPVIVARGLCRKHAQERQARVSAADAARGRPAARGYGAEWRVRRGVYLEEHPYCVDPLRRHPSQRRRSNTVDHDVPLRDGGKDDPSNWQAVCWSCHSAKTVIQDGGFGRARRRRRL